MAVHRVWDGRGRRRRWFGPGGECLLEGGQCGGIDLSGGRDTESGLERLQRGGELVGPHTVDRTGPESGQFEHRLQRSDIRQLRRRGLLADLGQLGVSALAVAISTKPVSASPLSFCSSFTASTVWGP